LQNQQPSIGFIGSGNMATAIIKGLLEQGYAADKLLACDPSSEQLERLNQDLRAFRKQIQTSTDNSAAGQCEILVLAVKPQVLPEVARDLSQHIRSDCLIISVAAGIRLELLQEYLDGRATVRCMPNTPALLGQGAAGLFASANTTDQQKLLAKGIFDSVGLTQWLAKESDLDLVTAVSGSGPAYFFLFMEAMIDAAAEMGLDRDTAYRLCVQTCSGSALMAAQDSEIAELRKRVTSPKGTTERAIAAFEEGGLRDLIRKAMQECVERSEEMAVEASNKNQ
jgi:pyrroline-5-carboxylate reductase